mmetsp:Transcript_5175/g.6737  ORF Transcript_5175/g.6737 Transcript_5175/m.6737 type:complete len:85 (+) Transcript_5175:60-314(+)
MGNSVSVSPLERLVKAAGSGDITECESIRVDFFSKERSKHRSATEITQSFSNFLNSVESNAALNAGELRHLLLVFFFLLSLYLF